MWNEDDIQFAIENTEVIRAPDGRIQTFGTTTFRFFLITELMDRANQVRIRDGRVHAERPQIIAPGHLSQILLEGFGEGAREFADRLQRHNLAFLKYGFQFRKGEVTENVVHQSVAEATEGVLRIVDSLGDPLSAVIQGVDDAWEVCLLKFSVDMIQRSSGDNLGDFRREGLI